MDKFKRQKDLYTSVLVSQKVIINVKYMYMTSEELN